MKNKIRVVVDTNIFINSWIRQEQDSKRILDLIYNGVLKLFCSQDSMGELVYITKMFADHTNDIIIKKSIMDKVMNLLLDCSAVNTVGIMSIPINDPCDIMFIKTAIKGHVDYLISNDKKSGMHNIKQFDFKVVTAEEFLNEYDSQVAVGDSD